MKQKKGLTTIKTRLGWFRYYAGRWARSQDDMALHLAIWYWLLHIEHDDPTPVEKAMLELEPA